MSGMAEKSGRKDRRDGYDGGSRGTMGIKAEGTGNQGKKLDGRPHGVTPVTIERADIRLRDEKSEHRQGLAAIFQLVRIVTGATGYNKKRSFTATVLSVSPLVRLPVPGSMP